MTINGYEWKELANFMVCHKLKKFQFKGENVEYDFSQLLSYEYVEDGTTITKSKGGIGRAIIGGALAGGVGALVGASTAKHKTQDIITKSYVLIATANDQKSHYVHIITMKTKKSGFYYSTMTNLANAIINELKCIEQENSQSVTSTGDPYEEVKKAKELLDMGLISQTEFDAKKKQLLNL